MSGDYSRKTFDPRRDFSGVLMQQGRVQLDADWNELVGIINRRMRAETTDIIGRGTVPKETLDGFHIQISGGALTIGRGRIYVDGLLAENHGKAPLEFDSVLGEQRGTAALPYNEQPYFPNAATAASAPAEGGPHLVYLDVWQREVTYLEVPELVENAVGVDTTTRLQTVWQVRVLSNIGANAGCDTPDDQVPGWSDIIRPSAGRLSTDAVGVASEDDPCVIPPSGGYRGLENRLYRVEIHDRGTSGKATFKWSRDNASVATSVTAITSLDKLTVARVGRDNTLRFSVGDWIEIADEWLEFAQQPGLIRQIMDVDEATQNITLTSALPAGTFPTDAQGNTDPQRHTRIKRWDQRGKVADTNNNLLVDLDAPDSKGLIPVPVHGTSVILEDGVKVTFDTSAGGSYRVGDFWCFAARTADASVEKLVQSSPRGIHHHYSRLALVTFPNMVADCRTFWPPPVAEGKGCDCTLCVSADEHNQGTFTIQDAVDQLSTRGGTICLGPGKFSLVQRPLRLDQSFAVRIRGQGAATVLIQREDAAFVLSNSKWCTLDYFTIHNFGDVGEGAPAIRLSNSTGTTIERLIIGPFRRPGEGPEPGEGPPMRAGVLLEAGSLYLTKIRDNFIRARFGVVSVPRPTAAETPLLLGLCCEGNAMQCADTGVFLDGCHHYGTVIAKNLIYDTSKAGISITGSPTPLPDVTEPEVTRNTITPESGDGIVVGIAVRITENEIVNTGTGSARRKTGNGIRLEKAGDISGILVSGNRIKGLLGNGIVIAAGILSASFENNFLNDLEGNGLIMIEGSTARNISVLGNEVLNVATTSNSTDLEGIYLRKVSEGVVSNNTISGVGRNAAPGSTVAGVRLDDTTDARVSDNTIADIALDSNDAKQAVGVLAIRPMRNVEIADNLIRRRVVATDADNSNWHAIQISEAAEAGICCNTLHGAAEVQVTGSCRFTDNHVVLPPLATVNLTAAAAIVSANRIECSQNQTALSLNVPKPVTVLGNITGGAIKMGNTDLGDPWKPLNFIGP